MNKKGAKMNKKQYDRLKTIYEKLSNERNKCKDSQSMMSYAHNDILNLVEGYFSGELNSIWEKGNKTYTSTILVDECADGLTIKQTIERVIGGLRRKSINKELTFNKDGTITFKRCIGKHGNMVLKTIAKNNKITTEQMNVISSPKQNIVK